MNLFQSVAEAFKEGGWGMWPILAIFVGSMVIVIERALYMTRVSLDARAFIQQLASYLQSGNVAGAVQFCAHTDRPLARILGAGFAKAHEGKHRVLGAMDEAA